MEIEEVLAKATPRPWRITDRVEEEGRTNEQSEISSEFGPFWIAHCQHIVKDAAARVDANANAELIVTAVNAYERQRAVIARLMELVEVMRNCANGPRCTACDSIANAALAHAQELVSPQKQEEGK